MKIDFNEFWLFENEIFLVGLKIVVGGGWKGEWGLG